MCSDTHLTLHAIWLEYVRAIYNLDSSFIPHTIDILKAVDTE